MNIVKLVRRNNVKLDIALELSEEDVKTLVDILDSSKTTVQKCFEIADYLCDKYKLCSVGKQSFKVVLNNQVYYIQLIVDARVRDGTTIAKRKCVITYAKQS